tara:strand:+ start:587 stop:817 length:231 start_codon:yes stop_codon:yes gene_type:complete
MLLLILVCVGLSVFCFLNDGPAYGILSLLGMSPSVGMIFLGVVGIVLFSNGHYFVGAIPFLFIAWNIYGLKYMQKD